MITKYKKFIKISLSTVILFFVSLVFSELSKRGVEYVDILPSVPIARADIPAPVNQSGAGVFLGDGGGGGSGGDGGCDGGDGGGGGGGGDCM